MKFKFSYGHLIIAAMVIAFVVACVAATAINYEIITWKFIRNSGFGAIAFIALMWLIRFYEVAEKEINKAQKQQVQREKIDALYGKNNEGEE